MGDVELAGDVVETLALSAPAVDLLDDPLIDLRLAVAFAVPPRFGNAGADTLEDEGALKVGDCRDYREHRLADRGRGVDLSGHQDEVDAQVLELFERSDELLRRGGKAIKLPDENRVDLPGAHGLPQGDRADGAQGWPRLHRR